MTTFNGVTRQNAPMVIPKYLWIEVWDGNRNTSFSSYSYLVDIQNLQNPTGTITPPSTEPSGKRPVLIIPGIMGSELYDGNDLIWPSERALISSPSDAFLKEHLALDANGNSINNITIGDIVREVNIRIIGIDFAKDYFVGLITELESIGYLFNDSYFLFPYDWRLDLDQTKDLLRDKIESIKSQTGFNQIDVIAHSMGGLLVKDYLHEYGIESVDKLIFVGTPHLGAPKAAYGLFFGDIGVPIRLLNYESMKAISINSPAVYQLLPNPSYHHQALGYFRKTNGDILDYEESKSFLRDHGMNESLIDRSDQFFQKDLQSLGLSGIDVYNISGCKRSTLGIFHIDNSDNIYGISYLNGDGTVPLISSKYELNTNSNQFYVKDGKHSELSSMNEVRQLIAHILNNQPLTISNIGNDTGFCDLRGKKLTWRSPVEIHIYDVDNNHAGPIIDGFENNIPGVEYDIINGEKFIFLPTDEGQEYRIEAIGLDTRSFDLLITEQENDTEGLTQLFDNVQIVPNSFVSFTVSDISDDSRITFDLDDTTEPEVLTATLFTTADEALVQAISESESEPESEPQQSSGGGGGLPPSGIYEDKITEIKESGIILGESLEKIPDGTLVLDLSDGRTVYMIGDGNKYGFTSEEAFLGRGFRFSDVIVEYLYDYELGGII